MDDLQGLMVFSEVMETGSFSRAAQQLGIAKSSVSKKVSALEKQLGVRLIQRTTRKLRPTDEGQALYQRCVRIKRELDAAELEVARFRELPTGTVRISASPLLANARLAALLPAFLQRYPEVKIELHLSEIQSDMIAGGFDLSLRSGELAGSGLVAQRLCTIKTVLCGAPAYLDNHGRPRQPADIEQHNYLSWRAPDCPAFKQLIFKRGARSYRANISSNLSSTDAMSIREATLGGGGISLLPDFAIHNELHNGLLEILLPDYESHSYPLSLVYPQRQQIPAKVKAVSEYLKATLSDPSTPL